jgi:hypothetical protein
MIGHLRKEFAVHIPWRKSINSAICLVRFAEGWGVTACSKRKRRKNGKKTKRTGKKIMDENRIKKLGVFSIASC